MAYNRTYYFNFSSLSGYDYRVEFFDQVNVNNSFMDIEGKLGPGACEISYDSDGSGMYAPLKPSTMKIEFIVRSSSDQLYIDELRTNRTERDVYVHIYRQTVQGSQSPTVTPIWTGYLLMDLTNDKDESYPTIVNLKAVDGIASMKYYDFIPTATDQSSANYYTADDTWKATGNNGYASARTFVDWIHLALKYGGFATTAEGRIGSAKIDICADWLNAAMTAIDINPLTNTRVTSSQFYKQKDVEGDMFWEAMSAYDVIKHICITWGMRFLQWRGRYVFIQIDAYTANNGGTGALPVNVRRYSYYLSSGAYTGTADNIGSFWTKYQINLCTGYTLTDSGTQRLTGGAYGILPKLKQVTVDFLNVSDLNYFDTFPLLANPWYTGDAPWVSGRREETIIATIADPQEMFYQEIWLNFINNSGYDLEIRMNWTMVARVAGSSTWSKQLYVDWTGLNPTVDWMGYGTGFMSIWQTYQYGNVMGGNIILPQGQSTQNICGGLQTYVPMQNTGLTGDIEFGYETMAYWNDAPPSGQSTELNIDSHGRMDGSPGGVTLVNSDPVSNLVSYTNTTPGIGSGSSVLAPIVSGSIGTNLTQATVVQTGDDSAVKELKGILWGDTLSLLAAGGLEVWDGSAWVATEYAGEWGRNTLTGNDSLAMLLAEEVLKKQFQNVKTYNLKFAQGERGQYYNDGSGDRPNYAGPLSRYRVPATGTGVEVATFLMHTGTWKMAEDEWSMKLFEFKNHSLTGTTGNTIGIAGLISGAVGGAGDPVPTDPGGSGARLANPNGLGNRELATQRRNSFQPLTRISEIIETNALTSADGVEVTSLSIIPIGEAILKKGDKISIKTATNSKSSFDGSEELARNQNRYTFTLSSDQGAEDTSLSVEALTIYSTITVGDALTIDESDLIAQYQHKTRGDIGGMAVTSDSIDGAKSVGREQIFFRCDGSSLVEKKYYCLNGVENNKSDRFGFENTNAPSTIGTQRAVKSGNFICDADYTIESGISVITGTADWDIKIELYKVTPVDDTTASTIMTLIGEYEVNLDGDAKTQVDTLSSLSTATIDKGDIIIPHIYAAAKGTGTSFNFRGGISYTLIRKS